MSAQQELIEQLRALGISEGSARFALNKCNNNVEAAADYVFSGQADKDESSDLILKAFGRPSGSNTPRTQTPTPAAAPAATAKPTTHALAALGLRGAAVGGPTVTPPTPLATEAPALPAPQPVSAKQKSFLQPSRPVGGLGSRSGSERPSRSPSPFFRARRAREERRTREKSPEVLALRKDSVGGNTDAESDGEYVTRTGARPYRPRASAYDSPDESGTEAELTEDDKDDKDDKDDSDVEQEATLPGAPVTDVSAVGPIVDDDEDEEDFEDFFDEETEKNTEANAIYDAPGIDGDRTEDDAVLDEAQQENFDVYGGEVEQDVLGEGPNVVVPPDPLFPSQQHPRVRKSLKSGLDLVTSRPTYARDRCTIAITHGDPDGALDHSGKRMRQYVVLSDLSEESRYAVEWAIGTVARDGDEIFLISVIEDESKVDPKSWSSRDQAQKLKIQKERQTTALLLVRQVTGLLQRTRLNITVTCQALHAKNARHMLLDLIDFLEPTLVIVGSRGLGQLKGILLGSTSHYLVQKSSVPVMVARRRLRRPLRQTNPEDLRHSPRVSLASANIEKAASSKQEDDIVDAAADEEEHPDRASAQAAAEIDEPR